LERRKFLLRTRQGNVVVKFAGLGAAGESKLKRAGILFEAGLTPEPLALVHGFIIERWVEGDRLTASDRPLSEIGAYLSAIASSFPAGSGASAEELLTMCRRNIGLALGESWAGEVDRWEPYLPTLEGAMHRVAIDGKMDPHEWVRTPDGRLLKTDALDHHAAHDLIGCQDIAWDIAGAAVEFALDDGERDSLVTAFKRESGRSVDALLLHFVTLAYCAFRLGKTVMTLGAGAPDDAEQRRLEAARTRYQSVILRQLTLERSGNDRRESSLDAPAERRRSGNKPLTRWVDEEEAAPSR
jgi:hypothetical protein